jgi:hypothetical protein
VKLPARPPLHPKHIEERLKLAANGLQALSLTLVAAIILGPSLNASLHAQLWMKLLAGGAIGSCELIAFKVLRYIPLTLPESDNG